MACSETEDKVQLGGRRGKVIKHPLLSQSPACPSQSALLRAGLSNQPRRFHTDGSFFFFFFSFNHGEMSVFQSGANSKQATVKGRVVIAEGCIKNGRYSSGISVARTDGPALSFTLTVGEKKEIPRQ